MKRLTLAEHLSAYVSQAFGIERLRVETSYNLVDALMRFENRDPRILISKGILFNEVLRVLTLYAFPAVPLWRAVSVCHLLGSCWCIDRGGALLRPAALAFQVARAVRQRREGWQLDTRRREYGRHARHTHRYPVRQRAPLDVPEQRG